MGQAALKQPAVGHFLAAGDAGLRDSREHEAFRETVLVHSGHVPWQEQGATREVMLEREDHFWGLSEAICARRASIAR